jgi:glutaredoxin
MSVHPEDARVASAHPLEVTLYTRPGCHLCEEANAVMQPLLREFGGTLREVNIDEDGELAERYGGDIPVVFVGGHKVAKHRVDPRQFRRRLEEARAQAETIRKQG